MDNLVHQACTIYEKKTYLLPKTSDQSKIFKINLKALDFSNKLCFATGPYNALNCSWETFSRQEKAVHYTTKFAQL